MTRLAASLVFLSSLLVADGHSRFKCPVPRDWNGPDGKHMPFDNTANKEGPCGGYGDLEYYGMSGVTVLQPGKNTLEWEEAFGHKGSPFRVALLDKSGNHVVTLLDHIPRWDTATPTKGKEDTYVTYKLTVDIPDVKCDQCLLQLLSIMTDKTSGCGMKQCRYYANDTVCSGATADGLKAACPKHTSDLPCRNADTCHSNYHSCADIVIQGTQPLDALKFAAPADWPYADLPASLYKSEAAEWKDGWLQGVPAWYSAQATDVCKLTVAAKPPAPATPADANQTAVVKPVNRLRQLVV